VWRWGDSFNSSGFKTTLLTLAFYSLWLAEHVSWAGSLTAGTQATSSVRRPCLSRIIAFHIDTNAVPTCILTKLITRTKRTTKPTASALRVQLYFLLRRHKIRISVVLYYVVLNSSFILWFIAASEIISRGIRWKGDKVCEKDYRQVKYCNLKPLVEVRIWTSNTRTTLKSILQN